MIDADGNVSFCAGFTPDYDDKTSYVLTVTVTAGSQSAKQKITIPVEDINNAPPVWQSSPTGNLTDGQTYATTDKVYTGSATPDVSGQTVVYSFKPDTGTLTCSP